VIITKQALQEGWDCPFAYVLCSLAASSNLSGMTQLIGRILRQPHAEKTEVDALDECYVVTHHAGTAEVVSAIKQGLEDDGLGDLVKEIRVEGETNERAIRTVRRRTQFASTDVYLPRVLVSSAGKVRPLDYDADVLYELNWSVVDVTPLVLSIPENMQPAASQLQRISLSDNGTAHFVNEQIDRGYDVLRFDASYVCRMISDIVPNAWVARGIVGKLVAGLRERGFSDGLLGSLASNLVAELRQWLAKRQDEMAEELFRRKVATGEIRFQLHVDRRFDWQMPFTAETYQPEGSPQVVNDSGLPLEKSLFAPQYGGDFNTDEKNVAVYLDAEETMMWWHRNVAKRQYALDGWRRGRIYPDFIFLVDPKDGDSRIRVLETKGEHLAGNEDTEYKRSLLNMLTAASAMEASEEVGTLKLELNHQRPVECTMIMMNEWRTKLPEFIKGK
jgi:type III restriction enzyme